MEMNHTQYKKAAWLTLIGLALLACDQGSPSGSGDLGHRSEGGAVSSEAGPVAGATNPEQKRRDDMPKIVAFGDSLTAGAGVPGDEAYPAQLQRRLNQAGYRYRVVNAGVSGETTAGGRRRVDWVLKSRPDIVILELGANDGLRGLSLDQMRDNLEAIIAGLRGAGAKVLLAGMKLPVNYGEEYRRRFEGVYRDLADKHSLTYMPFFLEGVGGQTRLNQGDGIHPTGDGYRVIVERLWTMLEPMLDKAPSHPGTGGTETSGGTWPPRRRPAVAAHMGSGFLEKRIVDAVRQNHADQRIVQVADAAVIRRTAFRLVGERE
jgi:acyl-CoA thioesterase-1